MIFWTAAAVLALALGAEATPAPTTRKPSKSPSRAPSKAPSTISVRSSIVLYSTTVSPTRPAFEGAIPRASSTTACINDAQFLNLNCGSAFALQGFVAEARNYSLPVNYATGVPFPSTAPIRGPSGLEIAANWGKLWDGTALERSLKTAGVLSATFYWTGIDATGAAQTPNCNDWTSIDIPTNGYVGASPSTSSLWISDAFQSCANAYPLICACVPKTLVPPTPAPQGRVVLYSSNSYTKGDLGSRTTTDAACVAEGLYGYLGCSSAYALLGYGGDASTNYALAQNPTTLVPFSSSLPVTGPSGIEIAANWSQLWNAPLLSTTFNAGVFVQYQSNQWTGILSNGAVSPNNCANWTSATVGNTGVAGYNDDTSSNWIDQSPPQFCNNIVTSACVCVPQTAAPSKSPSRSPSNAPTFHSKTSILLYSTATPTPTLQRYTGWIPRASSTTACINEPAFATLGCGSAFALQGFVSEGRNYSLPANYATGGPFPSTAPIRGPTGLEIAANWGKLWDGTPLERSLQAAGVVSGAVSYWTGIDASGAARTPNCLDWTAADGINVGSWGFSTATDQNWISVAGTSTCDLIKQLICACVPKTLVPPTPAPTGGIVLYSDNVIAAGNLGGRATTDAACAAQNLYGYLGCGSAYALLGYGTDASTNYALAQNPASLVPFSASLQVTGPTGIEIAANWSRLWSADLLSTTFDAGVFVDYQNYAFTGILTNGSLSATNCANWTSALHAISGVVGYDGDVTGGQWISSPPTSPCNTANARMCVCVPPAPTSAPSRSPTSGVTRSPTSGSTRSPSKSPTSSPTLVAPEKTRAIGSIAFVLGLVFALVVLIV